MKSSVLREAILYPYRYIIAYGLYIILLFGLLLTDINSVPGGISVGEMTSSVASNSLNPLAPKAGDVVNLPYHLLQKLSIGTFGLSPFSIRLPSLILAFTASIVLAVTLNMWFRKGIAILTLLIATASTPFIGMGRIGTAGVMYMLLLLIILMGAVKLTTRSRGTFIWKLLVAGAGLLLFYMPLGIYAVFALFIAGLSHPHVRYQIKRTKWWQFIILMALAGVLLAPIIFAAITDRSTLETLLGLNQLRDKLTLSALSVSLVSIGKTLFLFHKPMVGDIMVPFLSLTFSLLVAFGLVRTIAHRHSARSYLLLIWLAISLPLLVLNPTHFALLFVPCIMLMAIGLETFMREWYNLFPLNPYARIAALIPLTLITLGLLSTESSRYFYSFYFSDTTATYHPELRAVREVLKPQLQTQLIVPKDQVAFYDILRSKYPRLSVASPDTAMPISGEQVILAQAGQTTEQPASLIVTSHLRNDDVLLRVYKPNP